MQWINQRFTKTPQDQIQTQRENFGQQGNQGDNCDKMVLASFYLPIFTPSINIINLKEKTNHMAIKKSELYSSLWSSCDDLRGGMDASEYKDYVLLILFIKYISDKYNSSVNFDICI